MTLWSIKNTKFIDHNLKADYQILTIFGTTILGTTCHQKTIQVSTSPNICFCTTWGNQNTWNQHWNEEKRQKPSTTLMIVTMEKDNKILVVFGINISDINGHQITIQIPSSPNVSCCITWGNRTNVTWVKKKKNISKFNHYRYVALNSPGHHPFYHICSVMQHQVYGTLIMNISKLKKRLVEVWSKTLSTLLLLSMHRECISLPVLTQMANISNIYCHSCTTGQLDKLSTKVLKIWTKCATHALFESNNDTALNKNVIFWLFCFHQVEKKNRCSVRRKHKWSFDGQLCWKY